MILEPLLENRYSREYLDKETGSIYLRARYYDPTTGRFLVEDTHWNLGSMVYGDNPKDPLGLNIYTPDTDVIYQSGNLYVYALNNPVLYVDPDGNAGKRFHNAARAAMQDNMPIEDAVREIFTIDMKTVPAVIAPDGTVLMQEYESPDFSSLIPIGKVGKVSKVVKATAKYDTVVKVGMNNRRVLQEIAIKGYKVSVDLERGGSGKINTHVLVNAKKYIFNEKTGAFLDSSGNRLPNSLQGNQQIIDAKKKADQLIKQGWGNSQ